MRKRNVVALVTLAFVLVACDPAPPQLTEQEFAIGDIEDVRFVQPTSIAFGPDGRLYVSELLGRVVAVTLSEDGRRAVEVEIIVEDDVFEQILGIAVDPNSEIPVVYLSHNFINGTGDSAYPNEIVRLTGPEFDEPEVVISGLPVSLHNHGTNDLEFGPDGRLYIAQGGTTSSGAPSQADDPRWSDWDETPLSGAILVADVNADGFDGAVTYDTAHPTSSTNMLSGDVAVYSSGHRNTFDITFHTNGFMYSIDNGSSEPVPESRDCETLGPPPDDDPDQLNLVESDGYYGHANRNRGRLDDRQCKNISPFDEGPEDGMLKLVAPSSNSLIEVTGPPFPAAWHGDLLYGWWSGGEIRRLDLSDDGRTVLGEEIITDEMGAPISFAYDAERGVLYSADFGAGVITYIASTTG